MRGRRARIVAGALACVAVAGCGEDRLTRAELVRRADAICAEANERLAEGGAPTSPQEFERFARRAGRVTRRALEDLRELEPPEEEQERFEQLMDRLEQATDQLPELANAAREEDLAEAQRIAGDISRSTEEAGEIARELGLEECVGTGAASAAP